jgi:hypothetical protein
VLLCEGTKLHQIYISYWRLITAPNQSIMEWQGVGNIQCYIIGNCPAGCGCCWRIGTPPLASFIPSSVLCTRLVVGEPQKSHLFYSLIAVRSHKALDSGNPTADEIVTYKLLHSNSRLDLRAVRMASRKRSTKTPSSDTLSPADASATTHAFPPRSKSPQSGGIANLFRPTQWFNRTPSAGRVAQVAQEPRASTSSVGSRKNKISKPTDPRPILPSLQSDSYVMGIPGSR